MAVKWMIESGDAITDGAIINDFKDDEEAARFAANYEAHCYRIDDDGSKTLIYYPGKGDVWEDLKNIEGEAFDACGLNWYSTDEEREQLINAAVEILKARPDVLERITADELALLTDYNMHVTRQAVERIRKASNTVYTAHRWEDDGELKAEPGQEIDEQIYNDMFNVLPPLPLPRAATAETWKRYRIPIHGGFMMGEPITSDSEKGLQYMAFGFNGFGHGEKYFYLGLYPEEPKKQGTYYFFEDLDDMEGDGLRPAADFADDAAAIRYAIDHETGVKRMTFEGGELAEQVALYTPAYF